LDERGVKRALLAGVPLVDFPRELREQSLGAAAILRCDDVGDVGERQIHFAQRAHESTERHLFAAVIAIAGGGVDPRRRQQALLVVDAQSLLRQLRRGCELADGEHAGGRRSHGRTLALVLRARSSSGTRGTQQQASR